VNAIPFTATDVRDPKRTRAFANLADMAEEQKNVRVWGGVHYRFALRTSEGGRRKAHGLHDREHTQTGALNLFNRQTRSSDAPVARPGFPSGH
jgi:hypothetical protein